MDELSRLPVLPRAALVPYSCASLKSEYTTSERYVTRSEGTFGPTALLTREVPWHCSAGRRSGGYYWSHFPNHVNFTPFRIPELKELRQAATRTAGWTRVRAAIQDSSPRRGSVFRGDARVRGVRQFSLPFRPTMSSLPERSSGMRKVTVFSVLGCIALMMPASSVLAITNGQPDGNRHPQVGALVGF
jgi:hypothetical protein